MEPERAQSETAFCNALWPRGFSDKARSRGRGFCKRYTNLFSRSSSCPGMFSGLFFRDGRDIGFFRFLFLFFFPFGLRGVSFSYNKLLVIAVRDRHRRLSRGKLFREWAGRAQGGLELELS